MVTCLIRYDICNQLEHNTICMMKNFDHLVSLIYPHSACFLTLPTSQTPYLLPQTPFCDFAQVGLHPEYPEYPSPNYVLWNSVYPPSSDLNSISPQLEFFPMGSKVSVALGSFKACFLAWGFLTMQVVYIQVVHPSVAEFGFWFLVTVFQPKAPEEQQPSSICVQTSGEVFLALFPRAGRASQLWPLFPGSS